MDDQDVTYVLDMVIGDYLGVLAEASTEDEDIRYDSFVNGLAKIGKALNIDIHKFDVCGLLPQKGEE